ncbi:MAG: magnesium chelatase subunit D [Rhodobacteraceae bacterium]|nr:magnesium chelatase subunit D [Paracoccaceae bacterium]
MMAVDPVGLGGLWLRARPGPVRERFLALLSGGPLPEKTLHPGITDTQLFGGVDLAATLSAGTLTHTSGLLAKPAFLRMTMAERCTPGLAARLSRVLDAGQHCVLAIDEGAEAEERPPEALTERLGLFLHLDDMAHSGTDDAPLDHALIEIARARLARAKLDETGERALVELAAHCGIGSFRPPLIAIAAARAIGALFGRIRPLPEDIQLAAELVFAHRATAFEDPAQPAPPPLRDEGPDPEGDPDGARDIETEIPDEILAAAVASALPREVLKMLAEGRGTRRAAGSGAGATRRGNRRGRPLPSRPGKLDGHARIDLVATLRVAAPWQSVRASAAPDRTGLHIRPADIRLKVFAETSDRLLIFAVDASGSAAVARLAEAKGAIELLLSEAYARRDHVALVAFRGTAAELLLPPTRSLVQTKRRLSALPGGGGTPLASGLTTAMQVSITAQKRGMSPTLILLTDGRANIALDGSVNRDQAAGDATKIAKTLRRLGHAALVIDTGNRPQPGLQTLAATLDAPYVPLPRADAHRLSAAISSTLDG